MNIEECENQIIEKLKEIREITKQYDESAKFYLDLTIIDDNYIKGHNRYYQMTPTPIYFSVINGEVIHHDDN